MTYEESLYDSGVKTCFSGGEEDLLALYLYNGKTFPSSYDLIAIHDNLWAGFTKKRNVGRKRKWTK